MLANRGSPAMLMGMMTRLVSVKALSERTGLPAQYIRREADAGRLPCIRVGRRRMFDLDAVRRELVARAEREVKRDN